MKIKVCVLSIFFILLCLVSLAGTGWIPVPESTAFALRSVEAERDNSLDVPFVPTSEEVMAEMLRMAAVTRDDIVYDLGCGDGRMVIAAAKLYGARGVGVDLNPERIRESRENAAKAGVTHLVRFVEGNLFDADISQATVMVLYLLPGVNLKLRPKLLEELRPGARIVSHDFNMGDWKPDATSRVRGGLVYYWLVPANVSGTWEWSLPGQPAGEGRARYVGRFAQRFQEVTGRASAGGANLALDKARISGNRVRFTLNSTGEDTMGPMTFDGLADGDTIRGKIYRSGERSGTALPWVATRKAMTVARIEE